MPTSGASAARSICSGLATAATGIPEDTKQPPPVIKSLLFMVLEKPVLIVLLLTQRVDERKVAALMGTSRSRVRMATPEEVLTHTGSLIGSVPPVGHINRLRTLLDQQVLFHCEVRGVAADQQVTMSTAAVLSASQAWVADVAKHAASGASAALELPAAHSLHAPTALQRTLSPAGTRSNGNGHASSTPYARGTLPQPWVDGSQAVHLITRVAHKRRLSRLLVFVSLVPADTLPTPQESAAYVRRVWGHPSTGEPCEVQLIMGKTLERELGAPAAVELFKQVKAGQIVSVVATPQARPEDADQPSRPEVLDLVCHQITVLETEAGMPTAAYHAASQASGAWPIRIPRPAATASAIADRRMSAANEAAQAANGDHADAASSAGHSLAESTINSISGTAGVAAHGAEYCLDRSQIHLVDSLEGLERLRAAIFGKPATGSRRETPGPYTPSVPTATANAMDALLTETEPGPSGRPSQESEAQLPAKSDIHRSAATSGPGREPATATADTPCSQNRHEEEEQAGILPGAVPHPHQRQVVGLDAEWQPYHRREARTLVSLLQIATRSQAFLVDLKYFCQAPAPSDAPSSPHTGTSSRGRMGKNRPADAGSGTGRQPGTSSAGIQQDMPGLRRPAPPPPSRAAGLPSVSGADSDGRQLTAQKAAFSDFLTELFASADIIKVGFGLSTDLRRLCESYPELPCFGGPLAEFLDEASNGSGQAEIGSHALARTVPFRSHVDVLTLARAVWPSDRRKQVERLSLSGLSQLVLGSALDKSQQCSDWDQRPLTPAQVQYAAADAHSLTAIFDALIARQPQLLASPVWRTHLANYVVDVGSIASGVQRRLRTVGAEGGPEAGGGSRDERNVHGAVKSSPVWRAKRLPMGPPTFEQQANIPLLLSEWLGNTFPEAGRGIVMRTAAASADGQLPAAPPRYARGGGVVGWQNAVMLFVNVNVDDPSNRSRASSYPNAFLDNGRRMTWFPSAAHSVHHPVIRYMLGLDLPPATSSHAGDEAGTAEDGQQRTASASQQAGQSKASFHPASRTVVPALACKPLRQQQPAGQLLIDGQSTSVGKGCATPAANGASLASQAVLDTGSQQAADLNGVHKSQPLQGSKMGRSGIGNGSAAQAHRSARDLQSSLAQQQGGDRAEGQPIVSVPPADPRRPQVLLFCRVCARKRGPFVFCGRLFDPVVDWQGAAGRGELNCALQDYEALQDTAGFQAILQAAGGTAGPSTA